MTSPLRELGGIRAFLQLDGAEAFDRAVNSVNGSLDLTQVAAGRAAAALGKTDTAMVANSRSATSAASGSAKYKAAVLSLVATQERLNELLADEDATLRQVARAQASLITAQERVKSTSPAAAIEKTTVAADASVGALGRAQKGLTGLLETGAKLGLALGGFELAREAVEFVSAGKDLTTSLNGVQAASHATDAQMTKVRATAIGLGKDLTIPGATAVDAADAINDLVRAGMTLQRALASTRPTLLLASAAQEDTADTAKFLGDTLDDFALPASQATHVANLLAGAATASSGGLSQMFNAIKFVGPTARAVGVDVTSLVTSVSDLAKGGLIGRQAGTGLRAMFTSLAKDTPETQAALDKLGVSVWDAQGRFVGMKSVIGQLQAAQNRYGDNAQGFTKEIARAFSAAGATVAESLAHRGVEGYDTFLNRVKSGDVQKYADLMNRGVAASAAQLKKELTAAGIDVYDKLEGPLDDVLQWLGTDLPKDLGKVQEALQPVEQAVGHDFVTAWHAASDVLGVADHALVDIGHVLEGHSTATRVTIEAVLSLWAAYKGYQIVTAAGAAIRAGALFAANSVQDGAVSIRSAWASMRAEANTTAAQIDADLSAIGAAALSAAAEDEDAAAQVAEAEAAKRTATAATADQIASAAEAMGLAYASEARAAANAAAAVAASAADQATALRGLAATAAEDAAAVGAAATAAAETVTTESEVSSLAWGSMLGPLGVAAGAVGIFGTLLLHNSGDAQAAASAVDDYTSSVKQSTDALNAANVAQTNHALASKGIFTQLDQLQAKGIGTSLTYNDLTGAVNGSDASFVRMTRTLVEGAKGSFTNTLAVSKFVEALYQQRQGLTTAITQQKQNTAANREAGVAAQSAADATQKSGAAAKTYTVTIGGVTLALDGETSASDLLSTALDALSGNAIDAKQAQLQLEDSLAGVEAQEKKNGASLSDNTTKGRANKESLLDQIKSINGVASAQIKNGASVSEVTKRLGENLAALKKSYVQNGYNAAAVDKLIKKYGATPAKVITTMLANTDPAKISAGQLQNLIDAIRQHKVPGITVNDAAGRNIIRELQTYLDGLHDKTVHVRVLEQNPGNAHITTPGFASGTGSKGLPEGVATVGEQGWEAAVTKNGRTQILSHKDSMRLLGYGERVPGFAAGTGGTIPNTLAANGTGIPTGSGHESTGLGKGNPLDPFGWGSVYRAGVTGTASSVLFGASKLIGQALLTGVQSVKGAILVETESTAASMVEKLANATAAVQKQIAKSVAPAIPAFVDPTQPGGAVEDQSIASKLSNVLARGTSKAVTGAQSSAIAKANLATLKAHAKALDDDATSAKKNANQADAAAKAAATHASTVKGDKNATDADKKAAEDHATALQKQADQLDKTAKSSANLAKAADNLASHGDAAYKKLQTTSSNTSKAAQQDAQNIVSSFDSMVSDFLSTVSSFQSEISSGIEGGTSLSSIWSGFGDAVSQASDNLDQAVATWQDAVATGGDVASALTSMTQAQQLYNGAISNMSVGNLQNSLTNYLNQITQFSTDLQAVAAEGGGQALIEQIVSLGPTAGDQLAKALLQAGQGSVDQVSDTLDKINQTAANAGIDLSTTFFGQGEDTITQLIKGMEQQFPALDKALQPIEAKLQAAFTITPVVNPPQDNSGGSGGGKPGGKHAHGGLIGGVGTSLSDSNEEWLSRGEIVENAQAAAKYKPLLLGLNSGIPLSALLPSPVRVTPQAAVVNDNAAVVAAVQDMHKSLDGRLAALEDFAAGSTADQIGRQVGAHVTRSASLFGEAAAVQAQRDRRTGKRVG